MNFKVRPWAFQKPEWVKWGLSTPHEDWDHGPHDLVAAYLERHPEEHADAFDQYGVLRYFHFLTLAEKEATSG